MRSLTLRIRRCDAVGIGGARTTCSADSYVLLYISRDLKWYVPRRAFLIIETLIGHHDMSLRSFPP